MKIIVIFVSFINDPTPKRTPMINNNNNDNHNTIQTDIHITEKEELCTRDNTWNMYMSIFTSPTFNVLLVQLVIPILLYFVWNVYPGETCYVCIFLSSSN